MSRIEKINALIKKELGNILLFGEISDHRIHFVTIQNVDVSKDLQHARVRFSMLTDDPSQIQAAQHALNERQPYIRKLISQRVQLRYTPQFQFFFDKGVAYASLIDQRLEEIKKLKESSDE